MGLIYFTDWIRFQIQKFKNRKINLSFVKNNPNVSLPPDYLIYESFQINYHKYYTESKDTAKWLINIIEKHIELNNKSILDWGCGPGRIIRHLPTIVGNGCTFYGTDYNKNSIEWCSKHLLGIKFNHNSLEAKLPYPDNNIDVIYGLSILTHLSKKLHYEWFKELYRVLKPEGIMLLTTQGDNFKEKLTDSELSTYNKGEIVVRGNVKEGHRTYSAFHPKEFMNQLFSKAEIIEHLERKPQSGRWLPQDIWIIRKK